jgi:hypothetical protein
VLYWGYPVTFTKVLTTYLKFTPSTIFLYPLPPILRTGSTGLICPSSYMSTYYLHHIHPPTLFPYILPLPLVPTPRQDLIYIPVLHFILFCGTGVLNPGPPPRATPPALFLLTVFLEIGSLNYLPRLASNCNSPDLCLLSR